MEQALEHDLRADKLGEVVARFASLFAFAFQIANLKTPADEVAEVDAAHQYLASSLPRVEIEAVLRGLTLEDFGFDQRDIARIRVGVAKVAIPLETFSRVKRGASPCAAAR